MSGTFSSPTVDRRARAAQRRRLRRWRKARQAPLFCTCGAAGPVTKSGLCRPCQRARWRDRFYFGGRRSEALARDEHRCRICGGTHMLQVHQRPAGEDGPADLVTVCAACHARIHHLQSLRRWVPDELAALWQETHPDRPRQLQLWNELTASL